MAKQSGFLPSPCAVLDDPHRSKGPHDWLVVVRHEAELIDARAYENISTEASPTTLRMWSQSRMVPRWVVEILDPLMRRARLIDNPKNYDGHVALLVRAARMGTYEDGAVAFVDALWATYLLAPRARQVRALLEYLEAACRSQ